MDDEEYYLSQIPKPKKSRLYAKPIGQAMRSVISKHGLAAVQTSNILQTKWQEAVGELLAKETTIGRVYRGKLLVIVSNHLVMQELHMRQSQILKVLASDPSLQGIRGLNLKIESSSR